MRWLCCQVLEESPSSFVDDDLRARLFESARALASACKYESAGTVEFLVDDTTGAFYFLEMNTRLQVEHGVTEMVTGVDLVEMMLRQAEGDSTFKLTDYEHKPRGSSIQVRVYAENPARDFQPAPGFLQKVEFPTDLPFARFDTWVKTGTEVSPHYDPMIAKVLVHGDSREEAIGYMKQTLARTSVLGSPTNIDFLEQVVADPRFEAGDTRCDFVEGMTYSPRQIDVDRAGTLTSLQSYPGRVGWVTRAPSSRHHALAGFASHGVLPAVRGTCRGLFQVLERGSPHQWPHGPVRDAHRAASGGQRGDRDGPGAHRAGAQAEAAPAHRLRADWRPHGCHLERRAGAVLDAGVGACWLRAGHRQGAGERVPHIPRLRWWHRVP